MSTLNHMYKQLCCVCVCISIFADRSMNADGTFLKIQKLNNTGTLNIKISINIYYIFSLDTDVEKKYI